METDKHYSSDEIQTAVRNLEDIYKNETDAVKIVALKLIGILKQAVETEKKLKSIRSAFLPFIDQYEYETVECADTRSEGMKDLAEDEVWQKLKEEVVA